MPNQREKIRGQAFPLKWNNLVEYVRDTARLRLEIIPFLEDQTNAADGTTVLYAVDTNVITLYVEPELVGPMNSRGENGFSQVFHNDTKEISRLIGAAISRYIFYALNDGDRPLFVLGGHDAEVRGVYDYFAMAAENFSSQALAQRENLRRALEKIKDGSSDEERISILNSVAPRIVSYLFYNLNPSSRLRRINKLISSGHVLSLSKAIGREGLLSDNPDIEKRLWQKLDVPANLEDQITESGYRRDWLQALIRTKNEAITERRLRADCAALAKLQLINQRLKDVNAKLVLISADNALHNAADEVFPDGDRNRSFKQQYIRHPLSFLTVPEVLFPGSRKRADGGRRETSKVELLGTLLAKYSGDSGVNNEVLRKLASTKRAHSETLISRAKKVAKIDPEGALSIRSQWRALTKELRNAHALTSELAQKEMDETFQTVLALGSEEALELIDAKLMEKREETWRDFVGSFTRAGYDILSYDTASDRPMRRNVPPVNLTKFPHTGKFVRTLIGSPNIGEIGREEFMKLLVGIDEDDQSGYARSLAYGLLFAYEGRWHVASILARHAIDIAISKNNPGERGKVAEHKIQSTSTYITGREAYYFLAVSKRLIARTPEELQEVEYSTNKAMSVLEDERKSGFSNELTGIRFKVERLALSLAKLQFQYFLNHDKEEKFCASDWEELFKHQVAILEECSHVKDSWIGLNISRSLLCNIHMVMAVMDWEKISSELLLNNKKRLYRLFKENFEHNFDSEDFDIPITHLVRILFQYATTLNSTIDMSEKTEIINSIEQFNAEVDDNRKRVYLTVYDKKRFRLLITLIKRNLD